MRLSSSFLMLTALALALPVAAETPQTLTVQAGDSTFVADDDTITLVPISGSFSLSASTKGAAVYPPPKTRIDRLGIVCDGFVEGGPFVRDAAMFERSVCSATFEVGTKPMGGDPDVVYTIDKDSKANRFEVTKANGKVIEGTFQFDLRSADGNTMQLRGGAFVAEDRQR
jgi:hypothetical protein